MARMEISSMRYEFIPPRIIEKDTYKHLKARLEYDDNFTLVDKSDPSLFSQFKWLILICVLTIPIVIGIIYTLFSLIPSMVSYNRYLNNKRAYFYVMEYRIKQREDYESFVDSFYSEYEKEENDRRYQTCFSKKWKNAREEELMSGIFKVPPLW